jgi:hypothetical protein|tara:strand:+ start:1028 stop:1615 length:588 start_codon:yes stop_codon:yes gene_type:complete
MKGRVKMAKKKSNHYIDNKEFFRAMKQWKEQINIARESDDPPPPVTEYIGKCFMDIANNLAYRPNFINYPFRDEMIGDGIENCLMYCHNFNPEKSSNPFSYFTQIIYYAFLRRIQKEKKQNFIKYKLLENMDIHGVVSNNLKKDDKYSNSKNPYAAALRLTENDLDKFEPKKRKMKKQQENLDEFLDNEDSPTER